MPDGGAVHGRKAGEPKRLLKAIEVHSIDIVRAPSNPAARIDGVKALMVHADQRAAVAAIVAAAKLHQQSTAGGNSPNTEERALLMGHLQASHKALTGEMIPQPLKSFREAVTELRGVLSDFRLPSSPAGFSAHAAKVEAITALRGVLTDFSIRPPR